MHLNKSLTFSILVVCGVHCVPLVPSVFSNQIVAHEFIEPRPTIDQVSSETILVSSHPRPIFVDWTSSPSYVVQPGTSTTTLSGFNRPVSASTNADEKKINNITKHVLWEVGLPVKRSKENDSDRFYNLKVTDLQKGPFLG